MEGIALKWKLKQLIESRNDTAEKLAEAIGMHPITIHNKINGKTDWKLGEIKAIAKRYGLTREQISYVFFEEEMILGE